MTAIATVDMGSPVLHNSERKRYAEQSVESLYNELKLKEIDKKRRSKMSLEELDVPEEMLATAKAVAQFQIANDFAYLDEDPVKNFEMVTKGFLNFFRKGAFHPSYDLQTQQLKIERVRAVFRQLRPDAPEELTRAFIHYSGFPFFGEKNLNVFNKYINDLSDEYYAKIAAQNEHMRKAGVSCLDLHPQ